MGEDSSSDFSMSCVDPVASISQMTMWAWSSFWKVRSIPIFSMASCVSRIPAVSIKRKVIPCNTTVSSMTSRVVPCMSETMALSSLTRRLSSVDFPALVSPIMAVGTPFLMALPSVNESERRLMTRSISLARSVSFSRSANSTSSSLKSSSSSTSEANVSSFPVVG